MTLQPYLSKTLKVLTVLVTSLLVITIIIIMSFWNAEAERDHKWVIEDSQEIEYGYFVDTNCLAARFSKKLRSQTTSCWIGKGVYDPSLELKTNVTETQITRVHWFDILQDDDILFGQGYETEKQHKQQHNVIVSDSLKYFIISNGQVSFYGDSLKIDSMLKSKGNNNYKRPSLEMTREKLSKMAKKVDKCIYKCNQWKTKTGK